MKHTYFFTTILLFLASNINANPPKWVKNTPQSEFPTEYKYSVAYGEGRSRAEAELEAKERQEERMCLEVTRHKIEEFWEYGEQPPYIRCEREAAYVKQDKDGMFHFYGLYVYALSANTRDHAQFGNKKKAEYREDLVSELKTKHERPAYWDKYRNDDYICSSKQCKIHDDALLQEKIDSLQKATEQEVIDRNISVGPLRSLLNSDNYYNKKEKTLYVVTYIKKKTLKNQCYAEVYKSLEITENHIKDGISLEKEGKFDIAQARFNEAMRQCDTTSQWIESLTRLMVRTENLKIKDKEKREEVRTRIQANSRQAEPDRKKRLNDLLIIARQAEKERKLGTVLKYYYGAYAYMYRYNLGSTLIDYDYSEPGRPWTREICKGKASQHTLQDWLPAHIETILKSIRITCYRNEKDRYKLTLLFQWPDNEKVLNGDFYYNFNMGDGSSWIHSISGGNGVLTDKRSPSTELIDIQLEYQYSEQWHSDEAVREVVNDSPFDFSQAALHRVRIEEAINNKTTTPANERPATNSGKPYTTASAGEKKGTAGGNGIYMSGIAEVCQAITNRNYSAVQDLFTAEGYRQFLQLVNSATVKVRDANHYILQSFCNEVYVRSIKMDFQYHSKKGSITKNVVFVFNSDKKIDGIQFSLDEITQRDILSQDGWSDNVKSSIINFIENYQTAYALKRLDYLQDVFSDSALIIVGRVLQKTKMGDARNIGYGQAQEIEYLKLNKEEYMKRLERIFGSNEWINIDFANVEISQHAKSHTTYGLGMLQDYSSQHYGDNGYLFLIVDIEDHEKPTIYLRVWTPEARFGFPEYLRMLEEEKKGLLKIQNDEPNSSR